MSCETSKKQPTFKKVIKYTTCKPRFVFMKRDEHIDIRTRSAPPINYEEKPQIRKFLLKKADGTPITISNLDDDSSESDSESIENKSVVNECPKCSFNNELRRKMLEDLLKEFNEDRYIAPFSTTRVLEKEHQKPKHENIYTIEEILNCTEEKSFVINLLLRPKRPKIASNFSEFIVTKETLKDKATFELNKLTKNNINKVVYNIRKLDLKTIEDAKYIGKLIVFKAVNEPQFCAQYAEVVGELKSVLRSKEEELLNRKQTAFFGTVLTGVMEILEEKLLWEDKAADLKRENYKSTSEYEKAYEDEEIQRYSKKRRTFGAIDFVSHLYNLNIISVNHVKSRIDDYMKVASSDTVEVICRFMTNIGEKLSKGEDAEYSSAIMSWLDKNKLKFDYRIKFMVYDVLDKKKSWKKSIVVGENTFAGLSFNDDSSESIEDVLILDSEPVYTVDTTAIYKLISSICEDLVDTEEEDEVTVTDSFIIGNDIFGKNVFFFYFLLECITNLKRTRILTPFFVKYFELSGLTSEELFKILKVHKSNLSELQIDSPSSVQNYMEIITLFNVQNVLDSKMMNELKNKEYDTKLPSLLEKLKISGNGNLNTGI